MDSLQVFPNDLVLGAESKGGAKRGGIEQEMSWWMLPLVPLSLSLCYILYTLGRYHTDVLMTRTESGQQTAG